MRNFPSIDVAGTLQDCIKALKLICQIRKDDISDFNNLNKIFILGRMTTRTPSSSADVVSGDQIGDFCPTATFLYILISNGGSPVWRRITMGSW